MGVNQLELLTLGKFKLEIVLFYFIFICYLHIKVEFDLFMSRVELKQAHNWIRL